MKSRFKINFNKLIMLPLESFSFLCGQLKCIQPILYPRRTITTKIIDMHAKIANKTIEIIGVDSFL